MPGDSILYSSPYRPPYPPSSPTTSDRSASDDEDSLNGDQAWTLVDDGTSIGSSLHSSLIGALSVSSDDHDHLSSLSDAEDALASDRSSSGPLEGDGEADDELDGIDAHLLDGRGKPASSLGSSYLDAEASVSTLGAATASTLSHALIMPDPLSAESSFVGSDGTVGDRTPGQSLADLATVPHVRDHVDVGQLKPRKARREVSKRAAASSDIAASPAANHKVDKAWLRESTLWEPRVDGVDYDPAKLELMFKRDKGAERQDSAETATIRESRPLPALVMTEQYAADHPDDLAHDAFIAQRVLDALDAQLAMTSEKGPAALGPAPPRAAASGAMPLARRKQIKKWSYVAVASVTLALLCKFGPSLLSTTPSTATGPLAETPAPSVWSQLVPATTPAADLSPDAASSKPLSTAPVALPDFKLIKHALSTFSQSSTPLAPTTPLEPQAKTAPAGTFAMAGAKLKQSLASKLSFAPALRNQDVALSIPALPLPISAMLTKARATRQDAAATQAAERDAASASSLQPFRAHVSAAAGAVLDLYKNAYVQAVAEVQSLRSDVLALRNAIQADLASLCHRLAEPPSKLYHSATAQMILQRAARGAANSRQRLAHAVSQAQAIANHGYGSTRAVIDHFVRQDAREIVDNAAQRLGHLHAHSEASVRQAKRGLDRVVREAHAKLGAPVAAADDVKDEASVGPDGCARGSQRARCRQTRRQRTPRSWRRADKDGVCAAGGRGCASHRAAAADDAQDGVGRPPRERVSKRRRLLEAVHHGALQLVR